MRPALSRISIAFVYLISLSSPLFAQNCFNTGLNGTVINLPCNQTCVTVPLRIPHIKSTSDYVVNSIAYNPFPYVTTTPALIMPCSNQDDKYFGVTTLPFPFCFYDSVFNKMVISTNGSVTFDTTNALKGSNWNLNTSVILPFEGTGNQGAAGTCPLPSGVRLPKAGIFGVFCDFLPAPNDPLFKIEARTEGTAPCRKYVISFAQIQMFGCASVRATSQIVLHESTGLVEVFIENKPACSANGNLAIVGIQNFAPDTPDEKGLTAPGRGANNGGWSTTNEAWRFTPSGGGSRFVSCVVQDFAGTVLATGDTTTVVAGTLDVTFPTFCPTGATGQYVIKTTFAACENPANQLVSLDTITINKTNALNATQTTTQTSCGLSGTGTATITVPAGIGTAPYTFVLSPGGTTLTGNSPQQFTNLTAGSYSVLVTDASGGCTSTVPFTITSTGTLAVTFNVTNTACAGAANGSIVVNPPNGTPPITYSINGGPFTIINTFSGLAPGTYFVSTHDAAGCEANFIPVTVNSGTSITMTTSSTPTSCPGANNGSITITGATGTAPYQYSINGGPYQASNTFTGLAPGTYFISLIDAGGCTVTFIPVTVSQGTGTLSGTATSTPTSCSGATNGTITVTATSGSGPYQYSLDGGAYQASNIFNNVPAGSHNVVIREAGLCTSSQIPVTVIAGAVLQATATPASTSCNGAADGTITVNPTNGAGPYTFVLDGTTTQTGATTIFTGVSSGSHSVLVRDAAGCQTGAIPVTIAAGPALTGTAASTATTCAGASNGTVTVTATNSTGPYQYALDGGAPQASNVFTNVSAGSHNVTIRNALGCTSANIPVTVGTGAALVATTTTTSTACVGVNNGSITVTPTNGSAPYQYSLDGGANQASNIFTGVSAGLHNVVVTDNSGCISAPIPVTIAAGTTLTATTTTTSTSCAGASNGSITVTPTNGSAPYQYSLDGGANQSSNIFTGVPAGSHNVVVRDNFGCISASIPVTVVAGAALTATTTSTSTACAGVNNGSITVTPTNGSAPYQYSLDGGANQASNLFTGVSAGSHNVIVTDNFGCISAQIPVTVAAGTALTATTTSTSTACAGVNNGSITVTPTNGSAPYQYSLDGGANQASNLFTGVSAGSHNVIVTDNFGCISAQIPVTVAAGTALTATTTSTSTACAGVNNGSITVTPTNGSAPYQYSLDGGANQASNVFTGISAGSHNVVVTDNFGCISAPIPVTVATGSVLTGTATSSATSCNGATNGTITATATNGSGPYQYSLDGGTYQASNLFNGVSSGTHNVVIRDNFGCITANIPVTVVTGNALNATAAAISTSCSGAGNGSINVTPATNGTAPYLYSLNGGAPQASPSFIGLAAAAYTINVTDNGGCSSGSIPVTVNAGPVINVTPNKIDATCFSSLTGSITATPSANATAPIQYSLDNVTWQASPNFTGLGANTYRVYIRDAVGCTNWADITIGQPLQLQATTSQQSVLCNSGNNGRIIVGATGGTAPYSYSLNGGAYQPGNTFSVTAGNYTVNVRDANGCTLPAPLTNINVSEPALLTAAPVSTNATCDGGNDGTITINSNGGVSPYQYAITGGTYQSTNNFNVGPGTYDITIQDMNGCTFPVTGIIVGLTNNLTFTPMIDPAPICEGNKVSLQLVTNATQFAWTNGGSLSSSTIANPVAQPSSPTFYTVTATLGRCTINDDVFVPVILAPTADAGPPGDICYGNTYQLQGSGGVTYSWSPSTNLSSASVSNPVVTPDKTTTYTLIVTDANGCASLQSDQVIVKVTPPIKVTTYPFDTVVFAGVKIPLLATSVGTDYIWTSVSGTTGLDNPNIPNPIATAPLIEGSVVIYKVTATTSAGCAGDGFVKIQVYKGPDIYVVTAFTPNADGINETFIPFPVGIKKLNYFKVFNRWGNMLYSTTTLNKGWDGRFGGIEQASGVYIWMVEGVTMDNKIISKKGTVVLTR